MARLAAELPLILFVDDLQWDDTDSAWLIATLLSEPDAPAMLFVAASRARSEAPSHVLAVLENDPALARALRRRELQPLPARDLRALAQQALGERSLHESQVETVLRESAGHPLFALELLHGLRDGGTREPSVTLQRTIRARVVTLPAPARRLLELCCAAGHRLNVRASLRHADADVRDLRTLVALRLASATGVRRHDMMEPYHDRIREAVLAELTTAEVRAQRRALAELLLAAPAPRYELVVEHYLAAGDTHGAARYALRAAAEVASVLALHRLPGLLELAFVHAPPEEHAALHVRIADACATIGRTSEACRRYRAAADLEPSRERRWELLRMAMVQAFRGGERAEGEALRDELDRELATPTTRVTPGALWKNVSSQLRWAVRGPDTLQPPAPHDPTAGKRLTLAWSAALCAFPTDMVRSQYYATTAFRLAARLGDAGVYAALRAARAMAESVRTGRASVHAEREIEAMTGLATDAGDQESLQFVALGRVAYEMYTGRFEVGHDILARLLQQPLATSEMGAYVLSTARLTAPAVFFWTGRLRRSRELVGDWIRVAREHADLHLEHGLRAIGAHRLLDDDGERAVAEWSRVADRDPDHPAFRCAMWGLVVGLYADRLDVAERALRLSSRVFLRWNAHVREDRMQHMWARGAIAAARLAAGERSTSARVTLSSSIRLMQLERDGVSAPLCLHLQAVQAYQRGELQRGLHLLERTELGYRGRQLPLFAASASHALARLHPDRVQAHEHAARAASVFDAQGLRNPERWERALLAGLPRVRLG